jgi:hypothetical protein
MFGVSLRGITFPITTTFKRILQALALLTIGQAKIASVYREVSNVKNKKMVEVLNVKLTYKGRLHLVKLFH